MPQNCFGGIHKQTRSKRADDEQIQITLSTPAQEIFIFAHIPKTGGQTLRNCFMRHLQLHRELIHLGPFGEKDAAARGLLPFPDRSEEERSHARVILGHHVTCETHRLVSHKTPRYITFLRDPADLLVSYYNYAQGHRPADRPPVFFEQWLTNKRKPRENFMTRWLLESFLQNGPATRLNASALRKVNDALENFWFVGLTEQIDRDAPRLLERINVPNDLQRTNVGGVDYKKIVTLDDSLRRELYERSPFDVELYRYWKTKTAENAAASSSNA